MRCSDLLARERFLTTIVDRATGYVHVRIGTGETIRLSPEAVARLRRQLGEALAVALDRGWGDRS